VDRATPVPELELELDQEEDLFVDGEDVEDLGEVIPLLPLHPGPGEEKEEDWETLTTTKASPQSRNYPNQNQTILEEEEEEEENVRHLQVDVLDPSIKNCDGK